MKILAQHGPKVTTGTDNALAKVLNVDLLMHEMVPANKSVVPDLTSLYFMNEAGILHNLQERSYVDEPYTFMANVLVAVNPLKVVKECNEYLGTSKAAHLVHPYAVAEQAYQQMCFRSHQRQKGNGDVKDFEEQVSQSVIMSGESGAGKTESSKMILRHILFRAGAGGSEDLSGRLLESNEILESFGNSGTLRNHNSSRFGKFIKLWFKKSEHDNSYVVSRATISTYLLEKSRITVNGMGEYNFHVFYYLLKSSPEIRKKLHLDKAEFLKEQNTPTTRLNRLKNSSFFTGFSYLDPTDFDLKGL